MKTLKDYETRNALRDKEQNELEMAKALCTIFEGSPEIMGPIRLACKGALEQILELTTTLGDAIPMLCANERFLKVWNRSDPAKVSMDALKSAADSYADVATIAAKVAPVKVKLQEILKAVATLSVSDCGDVVRLFGTLVEDLATLAAGKLTGTKLGQCDKTGLTPAKAAAVKFTKLGGMPLVEWESIRASYRTPWNGTPFDAEHRTRRKEVWRVDQAIINSLDPTIQNGVKQGLAGNTMHTLNQGSTVRAIDLLFGLPQGADISGTTADTVFALETLLTLCAPNQRRMLCLLLPLVGMVPEYHHTTLEVALTLTMNDVVTYAPGFYTTLYPNETARLGLKEATNPQVESERVRFDEAKAKIKAALEAAEKNPRNRHMLVFTARDCSLRALVMETEEEVARYRKFAALTPARLEYFDSPRTVTVQQPYRFLHSFPAAAVGQIVADIQSPLAEVLGVFERS